MVNYKISVDLSGITNAANSVVDEKVFPLLSQAVNAVAQQARSNWMQEVYRAKLWSGEKQPYMESITMKMTGPFSAVIETDYKYAQEIETGRPPRDLKKMLDTSQKVRRTKDGRRFLVIPFRHSTPGNEAHGPSMPQHVYAAASQLSASMVVSQGTRRSGEITSARVGRGMTPLGEKRQRRSPFMNDIQTHKPVMVTKRNYQWGDRLGAGSMGPNQKGKSDRFAGMVRFNTGGSGPRNSTFMTFRIMMEGSNGWIVPAKPGLNLAKKVSEELQPLAEKAFGEAVKRTFR